MKKYLIALVLLVSGSVFAQSELCLDSNECVSQPGLFQGWNEKEKTAFYASEALLAADWIQTAQGQNKFSAYIEQNPILGTHPSQAKIATYFTAAMVGQYFLGESLGENKIYLFGAVATLELVVVKKNYSAGLRFNF